MNNKLILNIFLLLLFSFFLIFLFYFILNYLYILKILLSIIIIYVIVLILIAAFTLVERKVMGAVQRRVGPNVIGVGGLLQPFADGLKLATKEMLVLTSSTHFLFFLAPLWSFLLSLVGWSLIPFNSYGSLSNPNTGLMFLILLSSLNVYGLLFAGWSSNNKYALLGAIRSVSQMISYEIVFILILLPVIILSESVSLLEIGCFTSECFRLQPFVYTICFLPYSLMFFIVIVAETNRAPFDLPEAEAELVAGFNVEYSSFLFALFFLGEYSNIMLMSSIFTIFFFGSWGLPYICLNSWFVETIVFSLKLLFMLFCFIWIRAAFPRLRFDQLMHLCWNYFLPISFSYVFFFSIFLFCSAF